MSVATDSPASTADVALIVAGARNWTDRELIYQRLDEFEAGLGDKRLVVIEGLARGADQIANAWVKRAMAFATDDRVQHIPMAAEWSVHDPDWCPGVWCIARSYCCAAGYRRNQAEVDRALEFDEQFVLAFKDDFRKAGKKGTEDLVDRARAAGIHGLVIHH